MITDPVKRQKLIALGYNPDFADDATVVDADAQSPAANPTPAAVQQTQESTAAGAFATQAVESTAPAMVGGAVALGTAPVISPFLSVPLGAAAAVGTAKIQKLIQGLVNTPETMSSYNLQRQLQQEEHPYATGAGALLPAVAGMKPGPSLPLAAKGLYAKAMGGAVLPVEQLAIKNVGMQAATSPLATIAGSVVDRGEMPSLGQLATDVAIGTVLSDPNRLGRKMGYQALPANEVAAAKAARAAVNADFKEGRVGYAARGGMPDEATATAKPETTPAIEADAKLNAAYEAELTKQVIKEKAKAEEEVAKAEKQMVAKNEAELKKQAQAEEDRITKELEADTLIRQNAYKVAQSDPARVVEAGINIKKGTATPLDEAIYNAAREAEVTPAEKASTRVVAADGLTPDQILEQRTSPEPVATAKPIPPIKVEGPALDVKSTPVGQKLLPKEVIQSGQTQEGQTLLDPNAPRESASAYKPEQASADIVTLVGKRKELMAEMDSPRKTTEEKVQLRMALEQNKAQIEAVKSMRASEGGGTTEGGLTDAEFAYWSKVAERRGAALHKADLPIIKNPDGTFRVVRAAVPSSLEVAALDAAGKTVPIKVGEMARGQEPAHEIQHVQNTRGEGQYSGDAVLEGHIQKLQKLAPSDPDIAAWTAERQAKGLNASLDEYIASRVGEGGQDRIRSESVMKDWFNDVKARVKQLTGTASAKDINRLLTRKLMFDPDSRALVDREGAAAAVNRLPGGGARTSVRKSENAGMAKIDLPRQSEERYSEDLGHSNLPDRDEQIDWNEHFNTRTGSRATRVGAVDGNPFVFSYPSLYFKRGQTWFEKTLLPRDAFNNKLDIIAQINSAHSKRLDEFQSQPEFGLITALEKLTKIVTEKPAKQLEERYSDDIIEQHRRNPTPDTTGTLPPRILKGISSQADQVRIDVGGKHGEHLGTAFEKLGQLTTDKVGAYVNKAQEIIGQYRPAEHAKVLDNMVQEDIQQKKINTGLSTRERALKAELRKHLVDIHDEQRAAGIKINGREVKDNPHYSPSMMAVDKLRTLAERPKSVEAANIRNKWADYMMEHADMTRQEALKTIRDYVDATQAGDKDSEMFNAMYKAEGIGLPTELREQSLVNLYTRYGRRMARSFAWDQALLRDPALRRMLKLRNPDTGQFDDPAVDVALPDGTKLDINDDYKNVNSVQRAMDQAMGRGFVYGDSTFGAADKMVRSLILGPLTGVRNTLNQIGVVSPLIQGRQAGAVLEAGRRFITNYGEVRRRAFESGAYQKNPNDIEYGATEKPSRFVEFADKFAYNVRKWTAVNFIENNTRIFDHALGEVLAASNFELARSGNIEARTWLKQFGKTAEVEKWIGKKDVPPEVLQKIAKGFVERIQGSYDARDLPAAMTNSPYAVLFALNRWSVGNANNVIKEVVMPLKDGKGYGKFLQYTVGTLLGGIITKELSEIASGKKNPNPTVKEAWSADNMKEVAIAATGLMQASAYMGVYGDLVNAALQASKGRVARGASNPLWSYLADTLAPNIADAASALQSGAPFLPTALTLANETILKASQAIRVAENWLTQGEVEVKDAYRDKRVFEELKGYTDPQSQIPRPNKYIDKDIKDFKRTKDVKEVLETAEPLVRRLLEKSGGSIEKFEASIKNLKSQQYNTMPSMEANPQRFIEFYNWLVDTQGREAAYQRLQDWQQQKGVNALKDQVIESLVGG